jgi:hypothetical protein
MGLRRVNKIAFVLWMFTCSFHLLKYRCSTVEAWERRQAIVSVLQACAKMAVSSAYSAKYVLGGWGMSERNKMKRTVDRTAPWGSPARGKSSVFTP